MNQKTNTLKKRSGTSFEAEIMTYGKQLPQAVEVEEVILGTILLEAEAFDKAAEIMRAEVFYKKQNQFVFEAMQTLHREMKPIDIHTTCETLAKLGRLEECGGQYGIMKMTNSVVNSANLEAHCRIVFEKYLQREFIRVGGFMLQEGYADNIDIFELIDETERSLFSVTASLFKSSHARVDALLVEAMKEIIKIKEQPNKLSGVPSGFPSIDKITHGWQPTDLIILAARPSVGKTAFAGNLARNAALDRVKPTPVAFFSLEMSSGQLIRRMIASESEIPLQKIQRGTFDDNELQQIHSLAIQKLSQMPLYIDDSPGLNIYELRAKARRLKARYGIGLIIIDYLQLMSGTGGGKQNREQEISEISRGLKRLAKELNIPVVALSQLSREPEKRAEKRPQLSDLRESGAIEQDADTVMFLYRPEYYEIHKDETGQPTVGETELRFAKHRNGTLETLRFRAALWIQKFTEETALELYKPGDLANMRLSGPANLIFKNQIDNSGNDGEMPF